MSTYNVVPVAWMYPSKLELFKTCETRAHAWSIQVGNQDGELSVPLYSQATVTALQAHIAELEKDAAYGRVALRFVDRAGDVHPGIDDAETICTEFSAAMHIAIEKMMAGK